MNEYRRGALQEFAFTKVIAPLKRGRQPQYEDMPESIRRLEETYLSIGYKCVFLPSRACLFLFVY
jgi:hypothetical protein